MARLIFNKASVTASGTPSSASSTNISGIITESISMSEEMLQVIINDNQNMSEGYTTTMSFRTMNDKFDDDTTEFTDAPNSYIHFAGASSLDKARLTLYGSPNGGNDYYIDGVYVMGRRVYENGREEYEISCQIDSTSAKIVKA